MAFSFKNLASRMTQNNRFAKPPVGGAVPPVNRPVGMAPTAAPIPGPRPPMGATGPQGPGLGGRQQQLGDMRRVTGPIVRTGNPLPPTNPNAPAGGLFGNTPIQFKKGGKVKKAKASSVSARGDGIAKKGKTKGRFV